MSHTPLFVHTGNGFRLVALLFLMLMGALVGMIAGYAIMALFSVTDSESLTGMRIMQLSTQIGLFFLPPSAWALLFETKPKSALGLKATAPAIMFGLGVLLMLAALPLVHGLSEWNQSFRLPESLAAIEQQLRAMEDKAEALTKTFLSVGTIGGLLFNLLMIAVVPAVGEELLFRGVIQNLLIRSMRNVHLAVVLGALFFSTLHFQFYGLIPRFLLGLFLGYFFLWSGSLWVPILMHFVNNGLAVVAFYLHYNGVSDVPMEDFGSVTAWWQWVISALLSLTILLAAYKRQSKEV
jgi:membrane protease YdiL (CAAX protease family)